MKKNFLVGLVVWVALMLSVGIVFNAHAEQIDYDFMYDQLVTSEFITTVWGTNFTINFEQDPFVPGMAASGKCHIGWYANGWYHVSHVRFGSNGQGFVSIQDVGLFVLYGDGNLVQVSRDAIVLEVIKD